MKKSLSVALLASAFIFTGCANKVHDYAISTDNVMLLQGMAKAGKKIALEHFSDSGRNESKVMCRLSTPIGTPKGETFATYIEEAFKKELVVAGVYDPAAKTKLSLNLDDIYASTVPGNTYWSFEVTVKSTNGKSMKVKSRYDYESSYFAQSACSEMQRSFPLAVQKLINDIITNPQFKELIS